MEIQVLLRQSELGLSRKHWNDASLILSSSTDFAWKFIKKTGKLIRTYEQK